MKGDLRSQGRRGDERREEENVLQNMHQLQVVGEDTFVDHEDDLGFACRSVFRAQAS